jgi:hypothetical protein
MLCGSLRAINTSQSGTYFIKKQISFNKNRKLDRSIKMADKVAAHVKHRKENNVNLRYAYELCSQISNEYHGDKGVSWSDQRYEKRSSRVQKSTRNCVP